MGKENQKSVNWQSQCCPKGNWSMYAVGSLFIGNHSSWEQPSGEMLEELESFLK